jgi:hypothetical protein
LNPSAIDKGQAAPGQGRLADAERCFRQAPAEKPGSADGLRGLGFVLSQSIRLSEILAVLEEAARRQSAICCRTKRAADLSCGLSPVGEEFISL